MSPTLARATPFAWLFCRVRDCFPALLCYSPTENVVPEQSLAFIVALRYKQKVMDPPATAPEPYPRGTIVSCPAAHCGTRLYRLREAASFSEVVLHDDTLLAPLNATIPTRKVWDALACPLCGTALTQEGQLHTAARGWW